MHSPRQRSAIELNAVPVHPHHSLSLQHPPGFEPLAWRCFPIKSRFPAALPREIPRAYPVASCHRRLLFPQPCFLGGRSVVKIHQWMTFFRTQVGKKTKRGLEKSWAKATISRLLRCLQLRPPIFDRETTLTSATNTAYLGLSIHASFDKNS